MKIIFTLSLIFSICTMAFSQDKNIDSNRFDKLSWIADKWISPPGESMLGESITYENWVRLDDTAIIIY